MVSPLVAIMTQSPIVKTLDNLMIQLKDATETFRDAEKSIAGLAAAIRALAQVCEDEDIKNDYLTRLDEVAGRKGFYRRRDPQRLRKTKLR